MRLRGFNAAGSFVVALLVSLSLSCKPDRPPRTRNDIFQARQKVDTLYLTEDGQQIHAPGNADRAIVVDGKLAWPAWQCNNPNCPGRAEDGGPFLFPWPDPFKYVKDDGAIGVRQPSTPADERKMEEFSEQNCPQCLTIRDRDKETEQQRQQYKDWCQPHVTSRAAAQLKELDEELAERLARDQQRRKRREGN